MIKEGKYWIQSSKMSSIYVLSFHKNSGQKNLLNRNYRQYFAQFLYNNGTDGVPAVVASRLRTMQNGYFGNIQRGSLERAWCLRASIQSCCGPQQFWQWRKTNGRTERMIVFRIANTILLFDLTDPTQLTEYKYQTVESQCSGNSLR